MVILFLNSGWWYIIKIEYRNNKTEKICTDIRVAKRELHSYAEKLHSLITFLENAVTLSDVANIPTYYLHPLFHDRMGLFALDIAGRSVSWRLLIIPLDENGERWETKDVHVIYQSTRSVIVWEVSNHYE